MYQPYPSSGRPPKPPRPPAPVLNAVKLMYAGAAVSTVELIIPLALLAFIGDKDGHAEAYGHSLTASQVITTAIVQGLVVILLWLCMARPNSQGRKRPRILSTVRNTLIITLAIVSGLLVVVLWLWMAQASSQGRNWARTLSTMLFGLATLELTHDLFGFGVSFGVVVSGPFFPVLIFPVLTWLVGLAAVWLLWRPVSSAFFKPQGFTQAARGAQLSSQIRSSRERLPRQW
jgi:heme/copper-type cytochrome/quinol oxidase subunit 4